VRIVGRLGVGGPPVRANPLRASKHQRLVVLAPHAPFGLLHAQCGALPHVGLRVWTKDGGLPRGSFMWVIPGRVSGGDSKELRSTCESGRAWEVSVGER